MTIDTQESMRVLHEQLARSERNRADRPAPATVQATAPVHHENSTDATRGEPLVQRAQKRRAELTQRLAALPDDEPRTRGDIETALQTVDDLFTGDLAHLPSVTAASLNRWLETNKHLAEMATDGVS